MVFSISVSSLFVEIALSPIDLIILFVYYLLLGNFLPSSEYIIEIKWLSIDLSSNMNIIISLS